VSFIIERTVFSKQILYWMSQRRLSQTAQQLSQLKLELYLDKEKKDMLLTDRSTLLYS